MHFHCICSIRAVALSSAVTDGVLGLFHQASQAERHGWSHLYITAPSGDPISESGTLLIFRPLHSHTYGIMPPPTVWNKPTFISLNAQYETRPNFNASHNPSGHTNTQTRILLSAIPSLNFHTFPPVMCDRWNRPFSWAGRSSVAYLGYYAHE